MLAPFLSAAPVDPVGREVVVAAGATVPVEPPEPPEPEPPEPPPPEPPPEPEPLPLVVALAVALPPVTVRFPPVGEGRVVRVVFFGG